MRTALLAVFATLALAAPAFADDAADLETAKTTIDAASLSEQSDIDMWCGAAFTLAAAHATKPADADTLTATAAVLYGKAAPLLTADGVKDADLGNLSTQYIVLVNAQMTSTTEKAEHTQDECQAAADAK